jgi:hypothetical protein
LNQIIKQKYSKHHPLIKYLDNENFNKVDLTVQSPLHNVSMDAEKFDEMYEIIAKTMDEIDIYQSTKDLKQILQKIPQLKDFQEFFKKLRYLFLFENEDEIEAFIYENYQSVMKIACTSSRPFTGFTQENYDSLTRLKWRWYGEKVNPNNQDQAEEVKE